MAERCELVQSSSFTRIYKVYNSSQPSNVVWKEVTCSSRENCEKLERESQLLSRLRHPCICRMYGAQYWEDSSGDHHFRIAMQSFQGSLMREIVRKGQLGFDETEVEKMLWDISSALAYAQRQRVAHRDVKPENILKSPGSRYTLTDFGEGKIVRAHTDEHSIVGSTLYLSPELKPAAIRYQSQGGERVSMYNPFISDVYSLGMTALHMLLPDLPLRPCDSSHLQEAIRSRPLKAMMVTLLQRLLEEDPERRGDCIALHALASRLFRDEYRLVIEKELQMLNEACRRASSPETEQRIRSALIRLFQLPVDVTSWTNPESTCVKCFLPFQHCSSEPWREELLRSRFASFSTENICSRRCFDALSDAGSRPDGVAPQVCALYKDHLLSEGAALLHCKAHRVCLDCWKLDGPRFFDWWAVCPSCLTLAVARRPFRMELTAFSFSGFEEFAFVATANSLPAVSKSSLFPAALIPAASRCHACEAEVHCFQHWFLLICGETANYLCSYQCLSSLFPDGQTLSATCPKCSQLIRNSQDAVLRKDLPVAAWLETATQHCAMCQLRLKSRVLRCKHAYCETCLQATLEKYGEADFHCVRCGLLAEAKALP